MTHQSFFVPSTGGRATVRDLDVADECTTPRIKNHFMTGTEVWQITYQKMILRYGARSRVRSRHSSLRFICGFLALIQKASRILRVDVLAFCARIVTLISKSTPLCFCILCFFWFFVCHLGVLLYGHKTAYPFRQCIRLRKYYERLGISYLSTCNHRPCRNGILRNFLR